MDLGLHAWLQTASWPSALAASICFLAVLYAAFIAVGFAIEKGPAGRTRKIYDVPIEPGQYRWELIGTLRFIALVGATLALVLRIGVQSAPSTGAAFAVTFFVCMFFFDFFYYGFHRAMHSKRFYRYHRYHHRSRVNTPLTAGSVSAVEALGWAFAYCAPLVLISLFMPVSLEGFVAYLVYNTLGNVAGHVNAETVPPIFTRAPFSWFNHPISYHAMHHARINKHYCFGTTATDFVGGTTWDDWKQVYARVVGGTPMRRLEERVLPDG